MSDDALERARDLAAQAFDADVPEAQQALSVLSWIEFLRSVAEERTARGKLDEIRTVLDTDVPGETVYVLVRRVREVLDR